jgi:hypothetical protein
MINMAIAHPTHCAGGYCGLAKTLSRLNGLLSLLPKLPTVFVVVFALELAGCARNPAHRELNPVQQEVRVSPVRSPLRPRVHAKTWQPAEPHVRRPDPALLTPQPAPDCEFNRADVKAVDPDEWARLKTEFERQCYQDAEKAARDRLNQLQASGTCEVERVPQRRPVR